MEQKTVIMPSELTAENGAKYIFIGEFKEEVKVECPECDFEQFNEDCEFCKGSGDYYQDVPISWDTIKRIYALAVEKLSIKDLS